MKEKYIEYILYVDNFPLVKSIEYELNTNKINKVIIETFKDTYIENDPTFPYHYEKLITFVLNDVETEEEAEKIIKNELERILNLIAFDIGFVSVKGAYFKRSNLVRKGPKNIHEVEIHKSDVLGFRKLEDDLTNLKAFNNPYNTLYRLATQSSDEIAKYILLYSILAQLKGPSQYAIDNYILSKHPNIKKIKSTNPKFNGREETEYTYYRNQISHMDASSDLVEIREKVCMLKNGLEDIVKLAIQENIT